MMRALYSGVSGLKTHQSKMDVIGNNIANVNTVGFKSSSVTFQDIMYQTTSGASGATKTTGGVNAKQVGLGSASGSVKVAIDQSGAAQSTGGAFDLKLTDTNSTNFFIVNNGSENLFTRAGSFYVDGSGNLAMTSTGYLVQGWQVDPNTGAIRKDLVTPLRVLQPSNLTSEPEYTTQANVSGVLDKNDKNVTSDDGYLMSLTVYDNLGYSYAAMFSVKDYDANSGNYTVSLKSIYDSENNDILKDYIDNQGGQLSDVFGKDGEGRDHRDATSTYSVTDYPGKLTYSANGKTYGYDLKNNSTITLAGTPPTQIDFQEIDATGAFVSGGAVEHVNISQVWGIGDDTIMKYPEPRQLSVNTKGQLQIDYGAVNYKMGFNTADGTFSFVNTDGTKAVPLHLEMIKPIDNTVKPQTNPPTTKPTAFHEVNVDFSKCLNYNNGGSSTLGMDRGTVEDPTDGAGKKLGVLTGVSVAKNGEIFGSYDNGNTVLLGQIAVAQFANASGLEALGNNVYGQTLNSGEFDGVGVDVTADGGSMSTGQLEMSNVDLSSEFTEMITTQRGFQANSRIITVSDTLLEELTNLKR